ncbi:MAG: FecR family protein [Archangium sp.]|nr:FecR family protein [Archangium sp.]
MSHLEHDTLWALARTELDAAAAQNAQAHLAGCADCRVAFEDVQLAQQVLSVLPEPPPMPEQMARRVGASIAEAADAQAAKSFTSWWSSLFTPRFILAAAMGVVLVTAAAWLLASTTPQPIPPAPIALPVPSPAPAPAPLVGAPAKKLSATVASANKSTAKKAQVLAEGATVTTQKGGSVWMKLPDGSRAGLTATSEVKLHTLEEKQLTLELTRGSLAMVVPHREDRVLTVRAGDLQVVDLGTRFLVSREANRTLVAVEEGKVQVNTPSGSREVTANHAVSWSNGQLTELAWEPTPAAAPKTANVEPVPEGQPDSIARLGDEEQPEDGPPPPEEVQEEEDLTQAAPPDRTPIAADEQWAGPPVKNTPAPVAYKRMSTAERGFSLKNIERKLREVGTVITSPTGRAAAARNVMLTADANDCHHALRLADRWLSEPITGAANEAEMRRGVQLQQVRCLNHLGRTQDAETILKMIQTVH